jgi:UDP-N-acetylglucosamine--N-acetylmuramyl-(pentapeptide) pyrophosphoryl-undecaprenol N-acetylglucosamine transferase
MRISIACGGTGGHIFPGLATAQVLKERGHEVELWLAGRDVEEVSVSSWDGRIISVKACGFPSGISLKCIPVAWKLWRYCCNCRWMMKKNKPDVILAMGSYASVGPVMAARRLGVPIVLHEANVIPGRAIKFLSRFATTVALTFSETTEYIPSAKTELTGFPVRKGIGKGDEGKNDDTFAILIMGGSQGAHRLNEIAVEAVGLLKRRDVQFKVIHLSGRADEGMVRDAYKKAGVSAETHAFLKNISKAYAVADLAVSRSGAASCSELAIAGVPALFVPFPTAMNNHQLANARSYEKSGAANTIEEKDLDSEKLMDYLEGCYRDSSNLSEMKNAMLELANPGAVEKLADLVEKTVSKV